MIQTAYFTLVEQDGLVKIALSDFVKDFIGPIDTFDTLAADSICAAQKRLTVSGQLGSFSQCLPVTGEVRRTNLRSNATWLVEVEPDEDGRETLNRLSEKTSMTNLRVIKEEQLP